MGDENHQKPKRSFSLWISQRFGNEPKNRNDLIELICDAEQNELIDLDTRTMLEGVMGIAEERVRDIMIPSAQMVTIQNNQTLDECVDIILEHGHSRYPVVSHEDKDHILGILLAKDLLKFTRQNHEVFNIDAIVRPAIIIPEAKRVDKMLKEFRAQRYHMAIVVDEFGGISGLVTIEDILELIVGEIDDEYDEIEDRNIRQIDEKQYAVRALTSIEDFNEVFRTQFSDEEVDTIGGLVMQECGRLPIKNEIINICNYQFKVISVDKRRIVSLLLIIPDDAPLPQLEQ